MTPRSQNNKLSKSKKCSSNLFFHDMCSPLKGFLLTVPLKATTRNSKSFWFWLRGVQFDSPVWCTLRSLTPRWEAHRRAWEILITWLCCGMHTAEVDSGWDGHRGTWLAVGCTPRSQSSSTMSIFCVFIFVTPFDSVYSKNLWSKKDSLNHLWLTVWFSY